MRPAWDAWAGWLLILVAAVFALVVVPYPHNGTALLTVLLALAGAALVALSLRRQRGQQ